jgi:hypothetical protein
MFGFFKRKNKYLDKSMEYHTILSRDFGMKEPYISTFIKFCGDELSKAEHNIRNGYSSPDVSSTIKGIVNDFGFEYSTIVFVCSGIYMNEFKRGKILSTEFEYSVVGLLVKLKNITSRLDRMFCNYLINNKDKGWPNLDYLVFEKR